MTDNVTEQQNKPVNPRRKIIKRIVLIFSGVLVILVIAWGIIIFYDFLPIPKLPERKGVLTCGASQHSTGSGISYEENYCNNNDPCYTAKDKASCERIDVVKIKGNKIVWGRDFRRDCEWVGPQEPFGDECIANK